MSECECHRLGHTRRPGGRHHADCPRAGRSSGESGAHATPRTLVPRTTHAALVALGERLGHRWQDLPAELDAALEQDERLCATVATALEKK